MGLLRLADPPLQPGAEDARSALRRELLKPEYHDQNLLQRLLGWIERRLDGTIDAASGTPALTWFAATAIGLALVVALALLARRVRRSGQAASTSAVVLTSEAVSAAELRERADLALAEGRYADAVADGFRALALAQVERGRLDDTPGLTAHEVATSLGLTYPQHRASVAAGADLFDAVRYGERPATRDQAVAVLAIDGDLRVRR